MSETWHGLPFSWSRLFTSEGVGWGQRGGGGGGGGGGGRRGVRFVIKRGPFRSEVVRFV